MSIVFTNRHCEGGTTEAISLYWNRLPRRFAPRNDDEESSLQPYSSLRVERSVMKQSVNFGTDNQVRFAPHNNRLSNIFLKKSCIFKIIV